MKEALAGQPCALCFHVHLSRKYTRVGGASQCLTVSKNGMSSCNMTLLACGASQLFMESQGHGLGCTCCICCVVQEVEAKFGKYGTCKEARIVRNPQNGESRGFGFVAMKYEEVRAMPCTSCVPASQEG